MKEYLRSLVQLSIKNKILKKDFIFLYYEYFCGNQIKKTVN